VITVNDQSRVAVVTLSRPPVNALDLPMIEKLGSIFSDLAETAALTGVVLTGTGSAFSAGVDTKVYLTYHKDQRRDLALAITRMTASLLSLHCPLVAAVNGHALGGGFVLMLCCDYRLVTSNDTIRLGLTEARAGVPFPAGPVAIMKHELPASLLRQLTLSSRTVSPGCLAGYGVVDNLVDAGLIVQNAVSAARDLAAQPAFKIVKGQVRGALQAELQKFAVDGVDPFLASFE
jgi:enoyl-CoA hydratase